MPNKKPISRFPVPASLEDLPDDIAEKIQGLQDRLGFVPNVFLLFAWRPAEFRAFFEYHDALMRHEDGLTVAEKEMVVVATSAANDCQYCVVAHGAILRMRSGNPLLADQIAINYRHAPLTDRHRRLLDFSVKVAESPGKIEDDDINDMLQHGFSHNDIWDIASMAGFFAMSNRIASVAGLRPNDEFFMMGRTEGQAAGD